MLNPLI